jgi:Domain of unknown function (DUF2610)
VPKRLPYPGLRAFTPDESDLFFGREGCVDAMVARFAATRFLTVLGPSGSGKSSLVRTGFQDALDLGLHPWAGSHWTIADMHPGGQPMRNLAAALLNLHPTLKPDDTDIHLLTEFLGNGPRAIIEWVLGGNLESGWNLLIMVDQFEELFRYGDYAQREEAEAFAALLMESADASGLAIHVVLTMRSEYLGACALISGLADRINAGLYLTPRMGRDECREAIKGPASVIGFEVDPALVNRLLNDLGSFAPWDTGARVDQAERISRQADQLPVMQHVLNRLWVQADTESGGKPVVLRLADYDRLGGLSGALDAHGAEVMADLGASRARQIEEVFRGLVTGTSVALAVRRPCRLAELVDLTAGRRDDVIAIVEAFRAPGCNFLRTSEPSLVHDDVIVDISHESLIRQWTPLRKWLEKEARASASWQRLVTADQRYRGGEGGLLTGLDLQNLTAWWDSASPTPAWANQHTGDYQRVKEFLDQSTMEEGARRALAAQAAGRERRRLRAFVAALAAGVLILALLGIGQFRESSALSQANRNLQAKEAEAQRARLAAESSRKEADGSRLIAERERVNALNERDLADQEARRTSAGLDEISNTIYSEKYRRLLGIGDLQNDLMKTLQRFQGDLARRHAGVVSAGSVIRDDYRRGLSYEVTGDARQALANFAQSYERGLTSIRPQADPSNELIESFIENGFRYAWFLFDIGENEDAGRVLQSLKLVADRVGPRQKSVGLLFALGDLANLEGRYYSDSNQQELAKQYTLKSAEYDEQAAQLNPSDLGGMASRRNAYSNLYRQAEGDEEDGWVAKECQMANQMFAASPSDERSVDGRVSCLRHQANLANKHGKPDEAVEDLKSAKEVVLGALRTAPEHQQLLLLAAEIENAQADSLYGKNQDDLQFKQRMTAKDYFVRALRNRTIFQSNTTQVKSLYNGMKKVTFPSGAAELEFYSEVVDALAPMLTAFPKAPTLAFVAADASRSIGEVLVKDPARASEAGVPLRRAQQWFERSPVLKDITNYSEEFAGACWVYADQAKYFKAVAKLTEMIASVKALQSTCGPILARYPWDFYLRSPFLTATNLAGTALASAGRYQDALDFLEYASSWGEGASSTELANIYRGGLGGLPQNAEMAKQFESLASRQSMISFTISCDFGGVKSPFEVYIRQWPPEYRKQFPGIEDQRRWLKENRGGVIPADVLESLVNLQKVADENDTSLPGLAAYETGGAGNKTLEQAKADFNKSQTITNLVFWLQVVIDKGSKGDARGAEVDVAEHELMEVARVWFQKNPDLVPARVLWSALTQQGERRTKDDPELAIRLYTESASVANSLTEKVDSDLHKRMGSLERLGQLEFGRNNFEAARQWFVKYEAAARLHLKLEEFPAAVRIMRAATDDLAITLGKLEKSNEIPALWAETVNATEPVLTRVKTDEMAYEGVLMYSKALDAVSTVGDKPAAARYLARERSLSDSTTADASADALYWRYRIHGVVGDSLLHFGTLAQTRSSYDQTAQELARYISYRKESPPKKANDDEEELYEHYGSLSWYYLLAGDPAKASDAALKGLELKPDAAYIEANLAHALLLAGKQDEALAHYMRVRKSKVGSRAILDATREDFEILTKLGMARPEMDAILKKMGTE